jgi:hypothetical protein
MALGGCLLMRVGMLVLVLRLVLVSNPLKTKQHFLTYLILITPPLVVGQSGE